MVIGAPGALTVDHIRGLRRRHLGPLALFFVANAVFAALQSYLHLNVLSSPLASHLNEQDWKGFARTMANQRLQGSGESLAGYAARFDQAVIFNARVLMILMALALLPIVMLVFRRPRRPFGCHAVFSLHLYVFVLSLLTVSLLLAEGERVLGGLGMRAPAVDTVLSLFNLGACAVYIYLAIGTAYQSSGPARIAKTGLLTVSVAGLFVAYRFAMFAFTLYTT
jgi:hypothetical protein